MASQEPIPDGGFCTNTFVCLCEILMCAPFVLGIVSIIAGIIRISNDHTPKGIGLGLLMILLPILVIGGFFIWAFSGSDKPFIKKRFGGTPDAQQEKAISSLADGMKKTDEELKKASWMPGKYKYKSDYFLQNFQKVDALTIKNQFINALFNSRKPQARADAAFVIGTSFKREYKEEGMKVLTNALKEDDSPLVRAAALKALQTLEIRQENNEPTLRIVRKVLLTDSDTSVRSSAAALLGSLYNIESVKELLQAFQKEKSKKVREKVLIALEKLAKRDLAEIALTFATVLKTNNDFQTRKTILQNFLKYEWKETLEEVNEIVIQNLYDIFETESKTDLRILALQVLNIIYRDNVFLDHCEYAKDLNQLLDKESNTQITACILEIFESVKHKPAGTMTIILQNLSHKSSEVREKALHAIGAYLKQEFKTPITFAGNRRLYPYEKNMLDLLQKPNREEVVSALISMMNNDENKNLRAQAINFLTSAFRLNPDMPEEHIKIMKKYEQKRREIVKEIEGNLLNDKDIDVKSAAIKALAELGYWESKKIIKRAQKEDKRLDQDAETALKKIGLTVFEAYPNIAKKLLITKQTDLKQKLQKIKLIDAQQDFIHLLKTNSNARIRLDAADGLTRYSFDDDIKDAIEYAIRNDISYMNRFKILFLFAEEFMNIEYFSGDYGTSSFLVKLVENFMKERQNKTVSSEEGEVEELLIEKYKELGLTGKEGEKYWDEYIHTPITDQFWDSFAILKMEQVIPLIKEYCYKSDYQGRGDYHEDGDPWSGIRHSAVVTVGKIGGDEAVKILVDKLKEGSWDIARDAFDYLAKINTKEAIEALYKVKYRIITPYHYDTNLDERADKIIKEKGLGENLEIFFDSLRDESWDYEDFRGYITLSAKDIVYLIKTIEEDKFDQIKILASWILKDYGKITKKQQLKLIQLMEQENNIKVKKAIFSCLLFQSILTKIQKESASKAEKLIQTIEKLMELNVEYYEEIMWNHINDMNYIEDNDFFALIASKIFQGSNIELQEKILDEMDKKLKYQSPIKFDQKSGYLEKIMDTQELNSSRLLPLLLDILKKSDSPVLRRKAAWNLKYFSSLDIIDPLMRRMFDDSESWVRHASGSTLAYSPFVRYAITEKGITNYFEEIQKLIEKEENSEVKRIAIRLLGWIPTQESMNLIKYYLENSDDKYLRKRCAETLVNFNKKEIHLALQKAFEEDDWQETRLHASKTLAKLGVGTAIPLLLNDLKSDSASMQNQALRSLLQYKGLSEDILPIIVNLLKRSNDLFVQRSCIDVVKSIGSQSAKAILIDTLRVKRFELKKHAAEALIDLDRDEAITIMNIIFIEDLALQNWFSNYYIRRCEPEDMQFLEDLLTKNFTHESKKRIELKIKQLKYQISKNNG